MTLNRKLLIIFIILSPILNSYAIVTNVGVADIIFILVSLYLLLFKKAKISFDYLYLIIYILLNTILNSFTNKQSLLSIIRQIMLFLPILVIKFSKSEIAYLKKTLKNISLVLCLFGLGLAFVYFSTGKIIPWLLPIKLNYSIQYEEYFANYQSIFKLGYRLTSLFLEPAYFATYMGCSMFVLYYRIIKYTKFDVLVLICMVLSILLTKSLNGYFFLLLFIILEFVFYFNRIKPKILVSLLLVGILLFFLNYDMISKVFTRLSSTFVPGTSVNQRLISGFYLLQDLTPLELLFGSGGGSIENIISNNKFFQTYYPNTNYVSSLYYLIVSYGIVFIISLIYIVCRRKNVTTLIIFCFLLVGSSIYIDSTFIIILIYTRSTAINQRQIREVS